MDELNSREIRPALLGYIFIKDRAEAVLAKLPLIGLANRAIAVSLGVYLPRPKASEFGFGSSPYLALFNSCLKAESVSTVGQTFSGPNPIS